MTRLPAGGCYAGTILGVDLSLDERRDVMVVRVSGEVDLASAPRLRSVLLEVHSRGHHDLELDLHLVDFIDSSGIGVLLGAVRRTRHAGGSLRVTTCGAELRRLFSLLDLDTTFGLADAEPTPRP